MDVSCFVMCDSAILDNGSISLLRTFDVLRFSAFPAVVKCKSLAAVLRFSRTEGGPHLIRMSLMGDDGVLAVIHDEMVDLKLGSQFVDLTSLSLPLVVSFSEWTCPRPGDYAVHLTVDNTHVATAPIAVRKTLA